MEKFALAFLAVFLPWSFYVSHLAGVVTATELDGGCVGNQGTRNDVNISVYVLKNSTGDWIASFYAEKGIGNSTDGINLQLKHSVDYCDGRNVVRIRGIVREVLAAPHLDKIESELKKEEKKESEVLPTDKTAEIVKEKLRFNEKIGKNAVLSNNGRTVSRKSTTNEKYATVTTNRPLQDDEIFEVKLENTVANTGTFVFGVTSTLPDDIEERYHSFDKLKGTWVIGFRQVKYEGVVIKDNYGYDVSTVKVGERYGVSRKRNGDLHFYHNGVDLGVAASNVSSPVYGLLDVINYAVQFSIV